MPCDLAALIPVARAHGLPVIEDAACAIGSEIRLDGAWQKIGKPVGDIVCFSFHPRKVVTVGDGGMLTTRERRVRPALPPAGASTACRSPTPSATATPR